MNLNINNEKIKYGFPSKTVEGNFCCKNRLKNRIKIPYQAKNTSDGCCENSRYIKGALYTVSKGIFAEENILY